MRCELLIVTEPSGLQALSSEKLRAWAAPLALLAISTLTVGTSLGDTIAWNLATGGNWDTTTTNWTPDAGGRNDGLFANGDNVTFGNTAGGSIALTSNRAPGSTTVNAASGTYTFSGSSVTSGVLNKSGGGTLSLTNGANSFSAINLSGGQIIFTAGNQLGAGLITVSDNATLNFSHPTTGGTTVSNAMTIAAGKVATITRSTGQPSPTYSGKISGAGGLLITYTNGNSWTFSNAANDFAGGITVAGEATFSNNGALGTFPTITLQSGTLNVQGDGVGKTISLTGSANLGSGSGVWKGLVTGAFALNTNGNNLGLDNAGNSFTSLFANTGTVQLGVPGSLGTAPLSYTSNPGNALKLVDPVGGTFSNVLNMSSGDNRSIEVTNAGASINWTGAINASGGTARFINKNGPGTFATTNWAATNSINVNAGTFLMNDPTTTGMGNVVVLSGATLGGNGTMTLTSGNSVTINNGGNLSPGTSVGTLGINGTALVLNNTSNLLFELGSLANHDQVNVTGTGNLTLDGVLSITQLPGFGEGSYTLFTYTGALTNNGVTFADNPLSIYTLDLSNPGIVALVVAFPVPEPSTLSLIALGALGLVRRRRLPIDN